MVHGQLHRGRANLALSVAPEVDKFLNRKPVLARPIPVREADREPEACLFVAIGDGAFMPEASLILNRILGVVAVANSRPVANALALGVKGPVASGASANLYNLDYRTPSPQGPKLASSLKLLVMGKAKAPEAAHVVLAINKFTFHNLHTTPRQPWIARAMIN